MTIIRRSVTIALSLSGIEQTFYQPGILDPATLFPSAVYHGEIPDLWAIGELSQSIDLQLLANFGEEGFPVPISPPLTLQPGAISKSFIESLPRQRNFPFLKVGSDTQLYLRLSRALLPEESLSVSGFANEEAEIERDRVSDTIGFDGSVKFFLSEDGVNTIATLVEQKVQEAIASLAEPYLVGEPIFCFSKILGTDMIVSNSGWTWLRGDLWTGSTIGKATSTAYLADDRLEKLYLSWGGLQEDWDNNLPLIFPQIKGRKITVAGQGSGLSMRAIGERRGEEQHTMTINELPYHDHGRGNHKHAVRSASGASVGTSHSTNTTNTGTSSNLPQYMANSGNIIAAQGGNQPFNVLNPDIALPVLIFLGVLA